MKELLRQHLTPGRFSVCRTWRPRPQGDVILVYVGTTQRDDGSAGLSQVELVARMIAQHLNGSKVVVEKSTTPVRTAEQIRHTIQRYQNGNHEMDVAVIQSSSGRARHWGLGHTLPYFREQLLQQAIGQR